jgi:hypothetical protein
MPDSAPDREKPRRTGFGHGFEDVLPSVPADDCPDATDDDVKERDRWFWENRPPHHDIAW